MSYTAMYRKFRPDTFEDVKGQDHIVTTLKNQIKAGRLGHAYLFCGTRGTGKTTVSKILAKVVNCESPVDGNPCNECAMCKAIQAQTSMNVVEIDAASNNGVDNIREIVDEVKYSPTEGRFKVYIIDEVHMLSAGAFNALLKTLEEPPSYVMFILATTEVHKIPVTILSRCQRYDFKRITIDKITERLTELVEREGNIEADEKALRYIARMADGALRDALSLLDQCIAFHFGQRLTYDKVLEVLGTVDIEVFARLLRYICKGSVSDCTLILEEIITAGRDITQFAIDFAWYLRNLLIIKTTDYAEEVIEASSDQMELLVQEAKLCEAETLIRYIRIFTDLSNQMKFSTQKRVLMEIALVKLCCPMMETDYSSLVERIRVLEKKLEEGIVYAASSEGSGYEAMAQEKEVKPEKQINREELEKALPEEIKVIAANWQAIIEKIPSPLKMNLISARPTTDEGNGLLLVFENQLDKDMVDAERNKKKIEETLIAFAKKDVSIKTKLLDKKNERTQDFVDISKIFKGLDIEYN